MKFQKTSLASGKDLLFFSLPLILSGVLQQLYNWADAFIVGHVLGEAALASIGATSTLTNLLNLAITGFTLGLSIYAAKQCGGNRTDEVRQILSSFLLILSGIFALLSGFGAAFSSRILMLMDTPADMFVLSEEYLRVILWGVPFLAVYNTYAAILRAVGDTKTSFYAVLLSSILNVILDVILVGVLSCGVAGAAVATVISQIVMTVFIILYSIKKHPVLRFPILGKWLYRGTIKQGVKLGIPPTIQYCVNAAGNIVLQNFMNSFGSHTVAAVSTAYRIDSIMLLPIINVGSAISTMVARSTGAGDHEQAKDYLSAGIWLMVCISLALSVLMPLTGGTLVALFGVGQEAADIGRTFFRSISLFYIFYGISTALRGYVEGIGKLFFSSLISILALCARICLSYLLAPVFGNMSIAYSEKGNR
jgi:putative MATE family efflux protein